jgi:hypothetical protein
MPFDGVAPSFTYLQKFDQVIDLLETPGRWTKHTYRAPNGRYCLTEALNVVGIAEIFEPIILRAAEKIMDRDFCCIESFNDHPQTVYDDILAVLHRTRENIIVGNIKLPAPVAKPTGRYSEYRASTVWQKLFST